MKQQSTLLNDLVQRVCQVVHPLRIVFWFWRFGCRALQPLAENRSPSKRECYNLDKYIQKVKSIVNYRDYISTDPGIMLGKPIITGTRITVELVLRKLSEGMSQAELLQVYPHLSVQHILAALAYSADVIGKEELLAS